MYIAAILYPDCIEYEIMLAAEICNQKIPVRVATPTGNGHRGSSGIPLNADMKIEDIEIEKCAALLLPGGDPYELIMGDRTESIANVLTEMDKKKRPMGAICAGPAVLGKHGILKSRRFTHGYGDAHKDILKPLWEGAEFTDADVEVDGHIITAKPTAHIEFGVHFAQIAGVIESDEKRENLLKYYKNQKPTE